MKWDKRVGIFVVLLLMIVSITPMVTTVVAPPPVPKGVYGKVNANSTFGVSAYSASPADNGLVTAFIQNRSNEGPDSDVMKNPPLGFDHYWNAIEDNIPTWQVGDPCVVVVDFEDGDYLTNDRAGYVAYVSDILDSSADQQFADTELKKVPVPQFTLNGTNFINISWTPLNDPQGLIAGYTIYRSPSNDSDLSWSLVSGDKDSPVTDSYYNDTNVAEGTQYYYALKISYNGAPANVESKYYGEGSPIMESMPSLFVTDLLIIQFVSDSSEVLDQTIDIGGSIGPVKAQGYNQTTMNPTGTIDCTWSVDLPALGRMTPSSGTQSTFDAFYTGGDVVVTANNVPLSISDTFNVTIRDPTVDYILLTYTNGTEIINNSDWYIGDSLDIQARGYNNTNNTYVGPESVDWSVIGKGSVLPGPGPTTTFTTGVTEGVALITGDSSGLGMAASVTLNVIWGIAPTIDELRLTDGSGQNITESLPIGGMVRVYAAGFNSSTGGLVDFVDVTWDTPTSGSIDSTSGNSTNFTAGFAGGNVTLTGHNATLTDDLIINVLEPTVDYINITDAPDGNVLTTEVISNLDSIDAYASGYNNTGNTFAGLWDVTWSVNLTYGTFNPTTGNMTTFTGDGVNEGFVLITADDGSGLTDNFTLELRVFSLDYIDITDGPNGAPIGTISRDVGSETTLFASGYNNTGSAYVGLVNVDWTQLVSIGTFSNATGTSTVFTAGMAADGVLTTTITGANSTLSVSDSFTFNINQPTVDYIQIRNATDNQGVDVTSDEFTLGGDVTTTYYCAGYNNTADYVGDVTADWTLDDGTLGSVNPTAGTSTLFTALAAGTVELMANVSGITDTISITILEEVDETAPAVPSGLTVTAGETQGTMVITWTANTETDLAGYNIYRSNAQDGTYVKINTALVTETTYTDTSLAAGTYYYKITAIDDATVPNESGQTSAVSGVIAEPPDGDGGDGDGDEVPVVLLLLPIIIIVVLLLLFLMMKKKKPEEVAPEEEEKELPPPPGAKAEEVEEEAEEEEDVPPPEDEADTTEEEGEEVLPPDDEEAPPEEDESSKEE